MWWVLLGVVVFLTAIESYDWYKQRAAKKADKQERERIAAQKRAYWAAQARSDYGARAWGSNRIKHELELKRKTYENVDNRRTANKHLSGPRAGKGPVDDGQTPL